MLNVTNFARAIYHLKLRKSVLWWIIGISKIYYWHYFAGYDIAGYNIAGYDIAGYDIAGYAIAGYDIAGYGIVLTYTRMLFYHEEYFSCRESLPVEIVCKKARDSHTSKRLLDDAEIRSREMWSLPSCM